MLISMVKWGLQEGCQDRTMGKGQSLQQMVLGKLDSYTQKEETGGLSYTTHKYKLKID